MANTNRMDEVKQRYLDRQELLVYLDLYSDTEYLIELQRLVDPRFVMIIEPCRYGPQPGLFSVCLFYIGEDFRLEFTVQSLMSHGEVRVHGYRTMWTIMEERIKEANLSLLEAISNECEVSDVD